MRLLTSVRDIAKFAAGKTVARVEGDEEDTSLAISEVTVVRTEYTDGTALELVMDPGTEYYSDDTPGDPASVAWYALERGDKRRDVG